MSCWRTGQELILPVPQARDLHQWPELGRSQRSLLSHQACVATPMPAERLPTPEDRSPTNATAGRLDRQGFLQRTGLVACRFEGGRDSPLKRRRCPRLSDLRLTIPSWPGSYPAPAGYLGFKRFVFNWAIEIIIQWHSDPKAERAKL